MKKWNLLSKVKPDIEEVGTIFEIKGNNFKRFYIIKYDIVYSKSLFAFTPNGGIIGIGVQLLSKHTQTKNFYWRYISDNEKMAFL